tara:strand:- start:44263 stop:44982 length:720 start_codon:yes stop_codon:yes gene_type:complete
MAIRYLFLLCVIFGSSARAHNISDPSLRLHNFKIDKAKSGKYEFEFAVKNTFLDKSITPAEKSTIKKVFLFNSFGSEIKIATLTAAKNDWKGTFDDILPGWNWLWAEGHFDNDIFMSYKFKGAAEVRNPDPEKEMKLYENGNLKIELVKSDFKEGVASFQFSYMVNNSSDAFDNTMYSVVSNNFGSRIFHSETVLDKDTKKIKIRIPHGISDPGIYRIWIVLPVKDTHKVFSFKSKLET